MTQFLHQLLERAATERSRHVAVIDRDQRREYGELVAAVRTCAAVLRDHGLRPGDRVGIYLPKSIEEIEAIFGTSMAGGVFVPINPLLRRGQVGHILTDCRVRFLITDVQRWDELASMPQATAGLAKILLISRSEKVNDDRIVADAFSEPREWIGNRTGGGPELAAILYTSGSSGPPKGVMLSHANLLAGSRIVCTYLGITGDDRILALLPFSFDYGLNQLITAVEKGATIVLLTFRFGNEIVRALEKYEITGLAGVPTVWAILTQGTPSFYSTKLPQLRFLTNSGGAIPVETVKTLRETLPTVQLVLMYGLTEAFRSTYLPPSQIDQRPTSIGKAIPETDVFLIDERGEQCAPGETGMLVHAGPTVSLGYWERPDETDRVFRPHPFNPMTGVKVCYTGDTARMDDEGYFYFVGRRDALIKTSGYRVSPTEVEEVLMRTGQLRQAAVIGLPDPVAGERVHAVVVGRRDADMDVEQMLEICAKELPTYMVPRGVEVVAALPTLPNGKVDYKRLRSERVSSL